MGLTDEIITLRIMLMKVCDGFSIKDSSKNSMLSNRIKILHILDDKDCTPEQLIDYLCMAKSNLANLLKSMIKDNVVLGYKNLDNSKNMYYRITEQGKEELNKYKITMLGQFRSKCRGSEEQLSKNMEEIINILKAGNDD